MIKYFKCPDGQKIKCNVCLLDCRMPDRCAPKSYLKMVMAEREWEGVPSVTQLLNGTLESWLKIKKHYHVSPNEMAFAISGTKKHKVLEEYGETPEVHLEWNGIQGTCDEIEENEDGTHTLIDYKTSGAFKVAQCVGVGKEKVQVGMYKNGNPQYKTTFVKIPPSMWDYEMQTNMYRIMLERQFKYKISRIKIFFTVRDGGIIAATGKGLDQNIYYQDAQIYDDNEVIDYFMKKKNALLESLESDVMPGICTPEERWHDRKCQDYCPVREICPRRQGEQ